MKAKIKDSHPRKHQQNSKIMQLSDFPQLSDQELELLVGGFAQWGSGGTSGTAGTGSGGTGSGGGTS